MTRSEFLRTVLGKPWAANAHGPDAYDCWHLAIAVQQGVFGRALPDVDVPVDLTWAWMMRAISAHPERKNWVEKAPNVMGIVKARDGALVLMARHDQPAHIGVWLEAEHRIIHCDPRHGVVCEAIIDLNTKGWTRLRFYDPR